MNISIAEQIVNYANETNDNLRAVDGKFDKRDIQAYLETASTRFCTVNNGVITHYESRLEASKAARAEKCVVATAPEDSFMTVRNFAE